MEGSPEHPFERIIGGTQEDKEKASKEFQDIYDARRIKWSKYEIEKTPHNIEIVEETESVVDGIVRSYGVEPRHVPLDHIYILKSNGVEEVSNDNLIHAIHGSMGQKIAINTVDSDILFSSRLAHEFFHAKAYKAGKILDGRDDVGLYRSGLTMFDIKDKDSALGDETGYFDDVDEAVTAELSKRFVDELGKDGKYADEIASIRKFVDMVASHYKSVGEPVEKIEEFERDVKYVRNAKNRIKEAVEKFSTEAEQNAYLADQFSSILKNVEETEFYERYKERKMFSDLLNKLFEGSNGKFKTKEEIFDEFAKAYFTGNYLTVARLVENVIGKGAFRKLAEETARKNK